MDSKKTTSTQTSTKDEKASPVTTTDTNSSTPPVKPQKSRRGCWIAAGIGCGVLVLLAVGFLVLVVALGSGTTGSSSSFSEHILSRGSADKAAVIKIYGIIGSESSSSGLLSSVGADADVINSQLSRAISDPDVKAIILKVDSPGGEVVASDVVYKNVLAARKIKPVVVWISSMGASGAYYISAAADKIIVHPQSMTGSIGVLMEFQSLSKLYEKVGIEDRILTSGKYKNPEPAIFDKKNPNNDTVQIFQKLIDESYEAFVNAIATGRKMQPNVVRSLADGRVFSGTQAVRNGLADQTGYFSDAVKVAQELSHTSDLTIIEYSTDGFWNSLFQAESKFFEKFGVKSTKPNYGIYLYYLLDL